MEKSLAGEKMTSAYLAQRLEQLEQVFSLYLQHSEVLSERLQQHSVKINMQRPEAQNRWSITVTIMSTFIIVRGYIITMQ